MTLNPRNKIVNLCSAMAIIGVAGGAAALASFNLAHRSIIIPSQEVNRAVKTDRFRLPDVTPTIAIGEKAKAWHKPVAPTVVLKSGLTGMDRPVPVTNAPGKADRLQEPVNENAATVVIAKYDFATQTPGAKVVLSRDGKPVPWMAPL